MSIAMGDASKLKFMLMKAKYDLLNTSGIIERYVMYNYICNLVEAYCLSTGEDVNKVSEVFLPKGRRFDLFNQYLNRKSVNAVRNFLDHKDFTRGYFQDVCSVYGEHVYDIVPDYSDETEFLEEKEFYEVMHDFFKQYGLEDEFDYFIKKKLIVKVKDFRDEDYDGMIISNPDGKNHVIVTRDFKYGVEDMITLAHEFGHVYDFGFFPKDAFGSRVLNYSYRTQLGESLPRAFEKLLTGHLIENNIATESVKKVVGRGLFYNYDYLIATYMLSCVDDERLGNGDYLGFTDNDWISIVGNDVDSELSVKEFTKYFDFDIWLDGCYGYGDVIGLFLKDSILREGLDNPLMADFLRNRENGFNPQFLERNGLDINHYEKVLVKEFNQLKK